jgi:hypothetical protein
MKRLLPLYLLFAIAPAFAQPALVQQVVNYHYDDTSITSTLTGVAAGDLLVLEVHFNSAEAPTSVTDSNGTPVAAVTFESGTTSLGIYYEQNAASGTHNFTVNVSSATSWQVFTEEFSGVATSSALDGTMPSVTTGTSATATSGSATPSQSGDLVIGDVASATASVSFGSWGNGFSAGNSATANMSGAWGYQVYGSTSPLTATLGLGGTYPYAAGIALFKSASAATVVAQAEGSSTTAQTSLSTGTPLNVQSGDRFCAVVASNSTTPPTLLTDTAGDQFQYLGDVISPQTGIYLRDYELLNGTANSADTFTATGTGILGVAVLQLRGFVNGPFWPPAPSRPLAGYSQRSSNPQAAPGTTANAITSLAAGVPYTPEMVIGFSAVPSEAGAAVDAAPSAGTGFTAQTGVWETWGGGAGDYLGLFETQNISSTNPIAATFTAQSSYGSGDYGSFVWVIPELGAVP